MSNQFLQELYFMAIVTQEEKWREQYGGEGSHRRSTEAVSDIIFAPCFILDVEMELL
jgi:hypothetical protein